MSDPLTFGSVEVVASSEAIEMMDSLIWRDLRVRLINAIDRDEADHEIRTRLLRHIEIHWSSHAPRQHEFHQLEHRMRQCEREIETQRTRLKEMRETMNTNGGSK